MTPATPAVRNVAVIGGGISGLVAAYRLRRRLGPDARIAVVDRAQRLGGTLRTVEFGGGPMDMGAEAFVGRRPEVPALLAELGLSDHQVHPSGRRPLVRACGRLHQLPEGTLMGIPAGPDAMRGLVDAATLDRIEDEPNRPLRWEPGADVAVGTLVADRLGEQVTRRSVDPLLGGVYAGLSGAIGVRAALPTLAAALDAGAPCLTAAVSAALPPRSSAPVFGGIRGGYGVLLDALRRAACIVERPAGVDLLRREAGGWTLTGPGFAAGGFDAVVVATPAPEAARLLRDVAAPAAAAAARIPTASSALVAMVLPESVVLPDNSGILVATGEPLRAKAFTLSSRKWPHLADRRLVRASFGRYGDDAPLGWSDTELAAAAAADLAEILDAPVAPIDARVQRWPGGLPQYVPGHADLVAEIRSATADLPGLALAGNYLDGVGVPACVAAATRAAHSLTGTE